MKRRVWHGDSVQPKSKTCSGMVGSGYSALGSKTEEHEEDEPQPRKDMKCAMLPALWISLQMILATVEGVRLLAKPLSIDAKCPNFPRVQEYMEMYNTSLGRFPNSGDYHVSGEINFIKKSYRWSDMFINITTCAPTAITNKDPTCATFGHWKFEHNLCDLIRARNTLWTKIYDSLTPRFPVNCRPLGVHSFRNAWIESRLLEALRPPKGKLWFVDIMTRDTREVPVFCFSFTGMLVYE